MKPFMYMLIASILIGCSDSCSDKWEGRYEQEARSKCQCLEPWKMTMTDNLAKFYDTLLRFDHTRPFEVSDEQLQLICAWKEALSDKEKDWNRRFGADFLNKESELSKCWNKRFAWSDEHPGNNTHYTVGAHAEDLHCDLVVMLISLPSYKEIETIVFE